MATVTAENLRQQMSEAKENLLHEVNEAKRTYMALKQGLEVIYVQEQMIRGLQNELQRVTSQAQDGTSKNNATASISNSKVD